VFTSSGRIFRLSFESETVRKMHTLPTEHYTILSQCNRRVTYNHAIHETSELNLKVSTIAAWRVWKEGLMAVSTDGTRDTRSRGSALRIRKTKAATKRRTTTTASDTAEWFNTAPTTKGNVPSTLLINGLLLHW